MLIVQISDMHVSKAGRLFGGRVDSRAAFERCVAHVLGLDPAPDLVLLTGDLAETGVLEEYDFIASQLKRVALPVLAIPGNHDERDAMAAALEQHISRQDAGHLSFLCDDFPLRVIGLDTLVPNAIHGELDRDRLEWLDATLSKSAKPTLIAMHHPPFKTGLAAMDNYGIKRGLGDFLEILKSQPQIVGVICGHAHRPIAASAAGVPVLLCPSSAFPFQLDLKPTARLQFIAEPAQVAIHSWSAEHGLVSHLSMIDPFPGPFALS